MKKLMILLMLVIPVIMLAQSPCDVSSRNSISLSYEYVSSLPVGVNLRVGSIAQSGNLSGMVGFGVHMLKKGYYIEDKEEMKSSQLSASAMLSWKIYHNEGVVSLHTTVSGHYYEEYGAIWKAGLRMDLPSGYKAFYIYPSLTSKLQPSIEMGVFFDL